MNENLIINCSEEIKKSLKVIKELKGDDAMTEVRIISKGIRSEYFGPLDDENLAIAVQPFLGKGNIYFTINPVKPEYMKQSSNELTRFAKQTTSDNGIEKITTLMIDLDPVRETNLSSTEEEREKAITMANEVKAFLLIKGWPSPVLADSGNGAHLLYKLDLQNTKESIKLLKDVLRVLDDAFTNQEVEVDKTTFNPSRICKLYGTIACKGEDTKERPHRMAKILEHPETLEIVTREQLESLVTINKKVEQAEKMNVDGQVNVREWLEDKGIEISKEKEIEDGVLYELTTCPWRPEHTNTSAFVIQFNDGGITAKCHHNSCQGESWYSLRDKYEPGWRKKENKGESEEKIPNSNVLINLAIDETYFHDDEDECFVAIEKDGHKEIFKVDSQRFKFLLINRFYKKKMNSPKNEELTQVINLFSAKAMFDGNKYSLSKRCAKHKDEYYYDLCDKDWRNVKISKTGWKLVENPPILFKRNKTMKPQELPVEYDDLTILNKHYMFKSEEDEILHMVDMVTKFIPDIPHPIIVIYGEKGASKTTTMKKDRSIVAPVINDVVTMPSSKSDLALYLYNNYLPCFDNIDNITNEKSDFLCMASTGGSFTKRKLFTNDEETILYIKRPIILNGINVVATRPDLLDRSILLELERISANERKSESKLWQEFDDDKPKILGAIFTTLSKAMSLYDEVELEETGRMADFTKWGYAIAEAAGIGGENFLQAYLNNQRRANLEAIESNPVGAAVVKLMENRHLWTGSVTDLHTLLNHVAVKEGINTINKQWPSQPNILSRRLKEIKSNLEDVGINYDIRHHSNAKMITIQNRFIKTNTVQAPKKFLKEDIGEIEI